MKILLLNASNTLNYGSMMLAENFITYFDPEQRHEFFVETDRPDETARRLRDATSHPKIEAGIGSWSLRGAAGKVKMLLGILFPKRLKVDADLIAVLGGDDFTEDHGWRALVSQLLRLNLFTPPVCFIGQSMGPFFSFRKPLCKLLLSRADRIVLRDTISYDFCKSLGLRNISKMPDLAFAPLAREAQADTSDRAGSVCFFPSELIWRFSPSKSRDDCIGFYEKALTLLSERFKSVLVLPHVLRPDSSDDRKMVEELSARVVRENITYTTDILTPAEVRGLISASDVIVTGRMHPAVSAVSCGVPVIAFAYSEKYHGVIARDCGLEPYVLDIRKIPFGELEQVFRKALDLLEKQPPQLAKTAEEKRQSVYSSMKEIREWYRS